MNKDLKVTDEAIRALLVSSVVDALQTMFGLDAAHVPAAAEGIACRDRLVGTVGFAGEANGVVFIHVSTGFGARLAASMLAGAEPGPLTDEIVSDVVGEFSNMVGGALKSRLCEEGHACVLTMPKVWNSGGSPAAPCGETDGEALHFQCGAETFELVWRMNPPSDLQVAA